MGEILAERTVQAQSKAETIPFPFQLAVGPTGDRKYQTWGGSYLTGSSKIIVLTPHTSFATRPLITIMLRIGLNTAQCVASLKQCIFSPFVVCVVCKSGLYLLAHASSSTLISITIKGAPCRQHLGFEAMQIWDGIKRLALDNPLFFSQFMLKCTQKHSHTHTNTPASVLPPPFFVICTSFAN